MGNCVVCKKAVDWELVKEEFEDLFSVADSRGVEALTEQQQVIYHGMCCSMSCYEGLN